ncbi:hypothetical protein CCY99_07930 [Helicobacter sp. 16-1353]|uniref:hypothetical protein n=1 Tax=Helicobacter sp. 16-1353 TaxID=2004996 RepID=UPI000DCBAE72|nr:hypothetical protein [Helicobacter sp. 16-1353]RAX52070.1 hypothetical protein CCY99_07930 [Helicobacter sp. 16-1353]
MALAIKSWLNQCDFWLCVGESWVCLGVNLAGFFVDSGAESRFFKKVESRGFFVDSGAESNF